MNILEVDKISYEDRIIFGHYLYVQESIKKFQNNSTPHTFNLLFGKPGDRLWESYVMKCDRNWDKFKTYLTLDQFELLLSNVHLNPSIYYE